VWLRLQQKQHKVKEAYKFLIFPELMLKINSQERAAVEIYLP
jgi:hypothetical protein